MAVCGDREDINSVCLTAVHNLLEKYNIDPRDIGRLEVGTETMVDKSKAVKTSIMPLFAKHGNYDIEGIDSKNACYGGTAAVLNSLAWVESSVWDGRYAIAVAGDIAVYEAGPARPTGGAGVVAMLIGPKAPMVVEPVRATRMEDVWDFYKPTMASEYPRVDGALSNVCYLRAIDDCYNRYADRFERTFGQPFSLNKVDYAVFHAPYNKLVQKSFGRLLYNDHRRNPAAFPEFQGFDTMAVEQTYVDKEFQTFLNNISKPLYTEKVKPSELITKQCGNSYCGSAYAGLLSLVANKAEELPGKRALVFSYGSGLAATLFSINFKGDVTTIRDKADVDHRLKVRRRVSPDVFTTMLEHREKTYTSFDCEPTQPIDELDRGTYYLASIDAQERRFYNRRMLHTSTRPQATQSGGPIRSLPTLPVVSRLGASLHRFKRIAK